MKQPTRPQRPWSASLLAATIALGAACEQRPAQEAVVTPEGEVAVPSGQIEEIDVNTATVEQLAVLPGLDRETAQRIVDYRMRSGGFSRAEDLLYVQGMTPEKVENLRERLAFQLAEREAVGATVDINTATWQQLAQLDGMDEDLAKRVVDYRIKNGPFSTPQDLLKVQGMTVDRLAEVEKRITLGGAPAQPGTAPEGTRDRAPQAVPPGRDGAQPREVEPDTMK